MTLHDPTSYADLSQGRIRHIDFHIQVDFSTNTLAVKATYQLDAPRRGPLFLDTFKIDMQKAHVNGRALTWEFDTSRETLGSRLHLKGLDGDTSFTLECRTSPEASALQWLAAAHLSFFYALCIASGCEAILPRVEAYAEKIGRMLYVIPVFRALAATEWSRPHARPLFERVKSRHHLITAGAIERILSMAGV